MKFLLRYPEQSVELLLSDSKVQEQQWNRFFEVGTQTGTASGSALTEYIFV